MINIMGEGGKDSAYKMSYVADTENDIKDLPTQGIAVGSDCLCIATSEVYILGGDKQWHKL